MKDNTDRHDLSLPARRSSNPPAAPLQPQTEAYEEYAESPASAPSGKRVSLRLVFRALRRHWLPALILWTLGSAGLAALAYYKIKPTYDAFTHVRVELDRSGVLSESSAGKVDQSQYMQDQVSKITSPTVLGNALTSHPELQNYALLRGVKDPEAELRSALRVGIIRGTSLIQIEMSSTVPQEAADMVNAVVTAYLTIANEGQDEATQQKIRQFKTVQEERKADLAKQRKMLEELNDKVGAANEEALKNRNLTTLDAYRRWTEQLTEVEIKRIAAKSKLDQLRNEKSTLPRGADEETIKQAVIDAFYADPRVVALETEIERAETKLSEAKRRSRSTSDPSVKAADERIKSFNRRKDELWTKLSPGLRQQLIAAPADENSARMIREAEQEYSALATMEESLNDKLDKLKFKHKEAENQGLQVEFARRDLARAEEIVQQINRVVDQLELDARNKPIRVNKEFDARPSFRANDRRTQIILASPLAVGLLLTGLLVLVELRGARVGDPDEIASRMKLQVIGVIPPLPQIRIGNSSGGGSGGNGATVPAIGRDLRAQRQLDEFVQSLDHLRVALCARPDPWGRDRHCVLITSACGSEGKTTLAAQLAERCVNAGLMTLLIDGDLRNPTLSRMLDAQDNPGLINVLKGEVEAEDVVMVIGDAGGFHLLPAGNPRVDPSRLLHSDRLGKLLAQARESFDMIIVDAPPVLPVPDALTIGRWTDGAVLAVRYDTSRFPLVERANRRLAHVGVPVIGAVVNGVRSGDSAYGGYYGSYGYGSYGSSYGSVEPASPAAPMAED